MCTGVISGAGVKLITPVPHEPLSSHGALTLIGRIVPGENAWTYFYFFEPFTITFGSSECRMQQWMPWKNTQVVQGEENAI